MQQKLENRLLLILKIFALFIIIVSATTLYFNTPLGREQISGLITSETGRETHLNGKIYFKPALHPTLHIEQLIIANMVGGRAEKMANIGVMEIAIAPLLLLKHQLVIKDLTLIDSEVNLEKSDKIANWQLSPDEPNDNSKGGLTPVINKIYLENSLFTYFDVPGNTDIKLEAYSQGNDLYLKGTGIHKGKDFNIDADIGNFINLKSDKPVPVDTSFTLGHTTLNFKGTVTDLTALKGLDLLLEVKGADAAELFPLFGIALLPTPPYDVTGELTYKNNKWYFDDFEGKLGDSDLKGDLVWDKSGKRPMLTAKFISENLNFKDLGPLIGLSPEKKVSEEQKVKGEKEKQSPTVIPDVPLDISKLSAMDADIEFTGKKVISPNLPLDDFYMKLILDDKLLKLEPIKFGTANGDITANFTINGRTETFQDEGEIAFKKLSLARILQGLGKVLPVAKSEGYIGGTMKLKGQGKSLHEMLSGAQGSLGLGMEGGQVSNLIVELIGLDVAESLKFLLTGDRPIPIRCVVGDFDINSGLMKSNTFVVDTTDTVVSGKGEIDLSNEKMNFKLDPQPKDSTLISLRSPIIIDGTLKNPNINVGARSLILRGGAAAGLGAIVAPVAVLAFLEKGLGKDSNCAALVRDLDKHEGKNSSDDMIPKNKNTSAK